MRVRVLIATTEGPAEVQHLAPEDPDVQSVVCLDRLPRALPISGAYHDFVRAGTGVIQRAFGHAAYRLDVGRPGISQGTSWQLGAYAAHALLAAGRLAMHGEPADLVLWATGELDRDLRVRPVEAVPEKLQASREALRAIAGSGTRIVLAVPTESAAELETSLLADGDLDRSAARPVSRFAELAPALGLAEPASADRPAKAASAARAEPDDAAVAPRPTPRRAARRAPWLAGCAALAAVLAWPAIAWGPTLWSWHAMASSGRLFALAAAIEEAEARPGCLGCGLAATLFRHTLAPKAPPPDAIAVAVEAVHETRLGECRSVLTGAAPGRATMQPISLDRPATATPARGLCLVRFHITATMEPLYVMARLVGPAAARPVMEGVSLPPSEASGVLRPEAPLTLAYVPSRWGPATTEIGLAIAASPMPLNDLGESGVARGSTPGATALAAGLRLVEIRHAVRF